MSFRGSSCKTAPSSIAAPMEFRFVKGGNTAMSATFAENPQNTGFGNLDLIGFVKKEQKAVRLFTEAAAVLRRR